MIRHVLETDRDFWFRLDKHISESEFLRKVRDGQGYVLIEDGKPAALLRYNLFWDSVPFCTMLFVDWEFQRRGLGRRIMTRWEDDMRDMGYGMIMTSTQADESAQHFYRKMGYGDSGGLVMNLPGYEQPLELFFTKSLRGREESGDGISRNEREPV